MTDYGRHLILPRPFEAALERTMSALEREGFRSIATLDVREMMRRHLDQDFRRYALIRACHPELTRDALRLDLDVGVLLVADVAVYELGDGETVVMVADPLATIGATHGWREERPDLYEVALRLEQALAGVLRRLGRERQAA